MTSVVAAAGVSVTLRGAVLDETEAVIGRLVSDGVPRALSAGSSQLWGPAAAAQARRRLGWLELPRTSRALLPRLAELAAATRGAGLDRVVLVGMGGSSLAAEAMTAAAGTGVLTVLDGTDPGQVRAVIGDPESEEDRAELARTVVVVSGECGTASTDALHRVLEQAFRDAGIHDLAGRFIVVAEPGSALESTARQAGHPVVPAAPDVGGRYAALTAFGLVPAALAGAEVAGLLDEAAALTTALAQPYDNPALALGAALGGSAMAGRDKLVIAGGGTGRPGLAGLAGWAEHLIAESTGKDGRGVLPVVVEGVADPGFEYAEDVRRVVLARRPDEPGAAREAGVGVCGPLGAQFLLWEYATAVAGRVLGVNPFDQPDVRESEDNTAALLRGADEGSAPVLIHGEPALTHDAVEVHGPRELLKGVKDLTPALEAVLAAVPDRGYLAVMAFLDRHADAEAAELRPLLAARGAKIRKQPAPVTFGWGPRLLHSTGQYHKGGPQNGVFLQLTGVASGDVPVPGQPYTLGQLQLAQAYGDLRALRSRGRPAVRIHLRDRAAGLAQLRAALS